MHVCTRVGAEGAEGEEEADSSLSRAGIPEP